MIVKYKEKKLFPLIVRLLTRFCEWLNVAFPDLVKERDLKKFLIMKSFIIFLCCIISGRATLAQTPSRTARTPKTTTVVTQSPSATQAATTKPALTTKSTTTQSPVISQAAVTSPIYTKMTIKLPFATAEKEYLVQKMGHFFVLNGDIVVGNDFPKTMAYSTGDRDYRWSNADIPFAIDPSIYANGLYDEVAAAINEFNTKTQLCLTLRTTQEDYIKFVFSSTIAGGGLSSVGRQGGEQHLWFSSTASKGTVIHELMHVAGFYHEQSREDRDQFVRINEANIMEASKHNFQIEDGVPRSSYDYCSIMHYSSKAFSKNNDFTINCMENGVVKMCPPCLGNGETFSDADIVGIAGFYNNVSRFPCQQIYKQEYFPYKFPNIYPSASQSAMAAFQHRAKIASLEPFLDRKSVV